MSKEQWELYKYKVEKRTRWDCPERNDARILGGPNLAKPLHSLNPRTIMGGPAWDRLRKRTYYLAGYKCQICGADCSKPGSLDGHELYDMDYAKGTAKFNRVVAICKRCHDAYHSGRLITMHSRGVPIYSTGYVLTVVEHCFKLIHDWNESHPDEPKLKAYATFLDYLKKPELEKKMKKLIEEYETEFWTEDEKKNADWGSWKLIWGSKEYPTPYKNYEAWEKVMEDKGKKDFEQSASNPFKGGAYDEIASLLAE